MPQPILPRRRDACAVVHGAGHLRHGAVPRDAGACPAPRARLTLGTADGHAHAAHEPASPSTPHPDRCTAISPKADTVQFDYLAAFNVCDQGLETKADTITVARTLQSLPSCKIIQARSSQGTFSVRGKILAKGTQGFFSRAGTPSDARGAPIRPCLPRVGCGRRPHFRIFFAFQDPILG